MKETRVRGAIAVLPATVLLALLLGACAEEALDKCDFSSDPLCSAPLACVPQCGGRQCGPDGCGGSCGACAKYSLCTEGGICEVCDHAGLCLGKDCGPDGCGRLCGSCPDQQFCSDGACVTVCVPDCKSKGCGDDGCGGTCGACTEGFHCNEDQVCVLDKLLACETRPEAGCPDCPPTVEDCVCKDYPECCTNKWNHYCWVVADDKCGYDCEKLGSKCYGDVGGAAYRRHCGADGAGNSCGLCPPGYSCHQESSCVKPSAALAGLGCKAAEECPEGICRDGMCTIPCWNSTDCPPEWFCQHESKETFPEGACVPQDQCWPVCMDEGRVCGPDNCGGSCGQCADGEVCTTDGTCAKPAEPCTDSPGVPGGENDCAEQVCEGADQACCKSGWDLYCAGKCSAWSQLVCPREDVFPDGVNSGCQYKLQAACDGCSCESCVCAKYPHCCLAQWDRVCVETCQECGGKCQ